MVNQNLGHVLDRETWTQRGWIRAVEPDTIEGEGSEDAIMFVGVVCARASMVGEEGDEDVDVDGAGDAAGGFPSLAAPLSDRIRVLVSVRSSAQVNLVIRAAGPHLFL